VGSNFFPLIQTYRERDDGGFGILEMLLLFFPGRFEVRQHYFVAWEVLPPKVANRELSPNL